MGSKLNPGKYDCHANALPDEPMFILLARDPSAPAIVEEWMRIRHSDVLMMLRPISDMALVEEAEDCARDMREWRKANDGKWRELRAAEPPGCSIPGAHPLVGSRWRHLKTGRAATIIGTTRLEATNEPAFRYVEDESGVEWSRSMDQFLDGRFSRLNASSPAP